MKTIEVKVYSFSELSDEAKEKAIQNERNSEFLGEFIMEEAHSSFEEFCKIFSVTYDTMDYFENQRSSWKIDYEDDIKELSGQRLATYIWNNYKTDLFKGKYYGCVDLPDKQFFHPRIKSKELTNRGRLCNWFNPYYSAIKLDNSCVLTGMCYDDDLLKPIYEFLEKPNERIDFEQLLNDCIYSLIHSTRNEYEYHFSDEGIEEDLTERDVEFTEDGERF